MFKDIHVLFRHFQPYCGIFEPCITVIYSEPFHIQNSGIFRTWDIGRTISMHTLAYTECCVALAYLELCHKSGSVDKGAANPNRGSTGLWDPISLGGSKCPLIFQVSQTAPEKLIQHWPWDNQTADKKIFTILFIEHIHAYLNVFNNDSYSNISFLFYILLAYFPMKFRTMFVFWLHWCQFQCCIESTYVPL